MCQGKEIDLSKARVGDKVRSVLRGWITIDRIVKEDNYYPIRCGCLSFTINGKHFEDDLYPEIVEWLPAKRKVRKEVKRWIEISRATSGSHIRDGVYVHVYSKEPIRSVDTLDIQEHTFTYEVEE